MEVDYMAKLIETRLRHATRVAFLIGALVGGAVAAGFSYAIIAGLLCR